MVQTREKTKADHSVIRQLLSAGARVPPIAVFKSLPNKSEICSTITNDNAAVEKDNINETVTIVELVEVEDKSLADFNDIDLSSSSELFPEIGLTLPDLNDIDDMVTNETSQCPDYSKSVLNSVQIPTTPECLESVMSCSFPRSSDDALFTMFSGRGDSVTSPCLVTSPAALISLPPSGSPATHATHAALSPSDRRSPMQICSSSSSDSEAVQSPPPPPAPSAAETTTGSTTIKSLLSRPPVNAPAQQPSFPVLTEAVAQPPMVASSPMIPTLVQPSPAIPLSVLAMGDDDEAVEAQRKLSEIDGQNNQNSSPAESSSSEEEQMEEEPVKPVRRRWVKTAPKKSGGPKAKRERKASSVSSEPEMDWDMDMDDVDSEYGEDGERIERRRYNNRVAAQRCRQRKREYHVSLTKEIQQWECNNTSLKYDIHILQKEMQDLQKILQQHQGECTADPAELAAAGAKKPKRKSKKRSRGHKQKG